MEREIKRKQIFHLHDVPNRDYRFKDLPKDIKSDDIIEIHVDHEGFYSDNNSWDPHSELVVYRERPETDAEYSKRISDAKAEGIRIKKRRYEQYLKLKEEFEIKDHETSVSRDTE